jgi:hypothetical protein
MYEKAALVHGMVMWGDLGLPIIVLVLENKATSPCVG